MSETNVITECLILKKITLIFIILTSCYFFVINSFDFRYKSINKNQFLCKENE